MTKSHMYIYLQQVSCLLFEPSLLLTAVPQEQLQGTDGGGDSSVPEESVLQAGDGRCLQPGVRLHRGGFLPGHLLQLVRGQQLQSLPGHQQRLGREQLHLRQQHQ